MIAYREVFYVFHCGEGYPPRWYVAFRRNADYHHVSAFYYDVVFEHWNLIEWTELGLFYGIIDDHELDMYVTLSKLNGGEILRYKAIEKPTQYLPSFGADYCVAGAKHLANIKSWALTPDQLFSALQRRGARAAFTAVQQGGDQYHGKSVRLATFGT